MATMASVVDGCLAEGGEWGVETLTQACILAGLSVSEVQVAANCTVRASQKKIGRGSKPKTYVSLSSKPAPVKIQPVAVKVIHIEPLATPKLEDKPRKVRGKAVKKSTKYDAEAVLAQVEARLGPPSLKMPTDGAHYLLLDEASAYTANYIIERLKTVPNVDVAKNGWHWFQQVVAGNPVIYIGGNLNGKA